jgi:polysaccharide biosynthesis transport protein
LVNLPSLKAVLKYLVPETRKKLFSMDFMFFINALLRKKWVIVICTIAGIGAALLFTLTRKNMYMSAATYSTGFTMKQQVKMTADEGLNIFEIDQRFKNVIETFKSPVVICMLSYDLMLHDLDNTKMPYTTLTAKEKSKAEYKNVDFDKVRQILLQKRASKEILKAYDPEENKVYQLIILYQYENESILDQLSVDRVEGTDYLNIVYKSENPEMSAFVVNTIGKEFISFFNSINNTRTEESASKLDTLAIKKKKQIEDKTAELANYKKQFHSANPADRNAAALDMVKDVQSQLNTERSKLNNLTADLRTVKQNLEAIGSISENAPANNADLIALQQKNRDLAAELSKKGGSDAVIEGQMNDNQAKINKLQPSGSSGGNTDRAEKRKKRDDLIAQQNKIKNDIEAQNSTISDLNASLKTYTTAANVGGGEDVIAASMQTEIDALNKQYELMTNQLQSAESYSVAPDINFKQTLIGQPAIKPERSKRKTIVGVGGFAALMVSSLLIVIMDFLDQSVRTPSIFNKAVNLKLLTITNKIDLKNKVIDDYFNIDAEKRTEEDILYVENLRKLRYEIEASGKKIILFTSTKPQEGKSTIIEALANSFSLARKKVLLIDTNFSNNSLTEKFEAKPLLDQFSLNGEGNGAEKLASVNSTTKIPYVDIIGCQESAFSPEEVLQKNNLLQNLQRISTQYDYILMEGASLNLHADTKELLKYADGIVAVFSAKSTIRQMDKESIGFLKNHKEKLVGAVLNGVEKDNADM